MAKRLALLLWFVSGLGLLCAPLLLALGDSAAQTANSPPSLRQTDLTQPSTISAWLKQYADVADQQTARQFFDMGMESQNRNYWSRAVKAFAGSAMRFPSPTALQHYGDNRLRMLARVRARTNDTTKIHSDLSRALAIYRSALAAEEQLKMLSASELAQLKADIACLSEYLSKDTTTAVPSTRATETGSACRPLTLYHWE